MTPPVPSSLVASQTALYRAQFATALAAGTVRPYVLPYSLFGCFFLPVLYLCIPHTQRPWLYRARFLVAAAVLVWTLHITASTSGATVLGGYVAGLFPLMCTLWALRLLIWTRPQFDAARVARRPRTKAREAVPVLARGASGWVVDESLDATLGEWEYYWQPYPSSSTFLARLLWVVDLFACFRGIGWNWQPDTFPCFQGPSDVQVSEVVKLDSIPVVSKSGYRRCTTYREFFTKRLRLVAIMYVLLDLFSIYTRRDPYWTLGPAGVHHYSLPPLLAHLPGPLLQLYRSATALCCLVLSLQFYGAIQQLVAVALGSRVLGIYAQLWRQTDLFGPFAAVLDRGLAGFWGTWWHQTFRCSFSAPADWMMRWGLVRRSRTAVALVTLFLAFVQSGILHACGSYTTVPKTEPWEPLAFFLLSFVGIVVEQLLWAGVARAKAAAGYEKGISMRGKRIVNLVFAAAWLHMIRPLFVDDLARSGLYMYEPVPVSLIRATGLGDKDDRAIWRWEFMLPRWYSGTHWWESGIMD